MFPFWQLRELRCLVLWLSAVLVVQLQQRVQLVWILPLETAALALQQLVQRVLLLLEETTPAASHSPPIAQLRLLLVGGVSYAKESLSSLADDFKS